MLFEDLSLSKVYKEPYMNKAILTPLHSRAIYSSTSREGFNGCAQTGTGKTAAFAIPIIHQLHRIVGSSKKKPSKLH
jgi:ATP-dependent RNA helicase RhlE